MSRILGVDLGSVRVGLALSDPAGVTAQPLDVLDVRETDDVVAAVARRAEDLDVGEIVVGIPLRMDGAHGPEADAAESFAAQLEAATSVPVRRWDERLSTVEASRAMRSAGTDARRQRGQVDKVAAALILRAYLESRRQRT